MRPELGRAKRYAECHFVHIGALERVMLRQVVCIPYEFAKAPSSNANIKTLKIHWKFVCFLIVGKLLVPSMDHTSYGMMMLCQKHS